MIVLEILLGGPIGPEQLKSICQRATASLPAGGPEGVVLSGRMPLWLAAALVHEYHPRPWVAMFDPRLGGGVVVASHTPSRAVGEVVPVDGDDAERVTVEV